MRIFKSRNLLVPFAPVAFSLLVATSMPAQLAHALTEETQPVGLAGNYETAAAVSITAGGDTSVSYETLTVHDAPVPEPVAAPAVTAATAGAASAATGAVAAVTNGASVGAVFNDINAQRAAAGLGPMAWSGGLTNIAMGWSGSQASRNASGHNPSFLSQTSAIGCGSGMENVAYTIGGSGTPMTFWMGSPPHRAAILGSSTHVGVGAATSASGITYYTLNFGSC